MDPHVVENPDAHRFEIFVDGDRVGLTAYKRDGDVYTFTHTEIDDALEGQGLGSILIEAALDAMRERGATVVPQCPFVRSFIEEHDEYADLVKQG